MKLAFLLLGLLALGVVAFSPLAADACYYGCGGWGAPYYGYNYGYTRPYQYNYAGAWGSPWYGHNYWQGWTAPTQRWGSYAHASAGAGYWPYAYAYSYAYAGW
ncbi:MAG: hypothetical protein G01um1014106_299 [Parcubacteria group bacterium Gr01-1014_106]|nr:MAG: hypothetical protein G01um1014106_299 [Parcubacteria group bacterium Gr01-1014_106]